MQLNEYRHTHMQHKLPIDQKKKTSIISLLMIPQKMLKPQVDYCIREVIG